MTHKKANPPKTIPKKNIFLSKKIKIVLILVFGIAAIALGFPYVFEKNLREALPAQIDLFAEIHISNMPKELLSKGLEAFKTPIDFSADEIKTYATKATIFQIDTEVFWAIKPKDKSSFSEFLLEKIDLPNEKFSWKQKTNLQILSGEFSDTPLAAKFSDWIIIPSKNSHLETLSKNITPKSWNTKKRRSTNLFSIEISEKNLAIMLKNYAPIFRAISETYTTEKDSQGVLFTGDMEKDKLHVSIHWKSTEKPSETINATKLSAVTPNNALFFLVGNNISEKFRNFKNGIQKKSPELAAIFEQVFQRAAESFFGPKVDFNADFLAKAHNEYGLFIPQEKADEWVFLTEFDTDDKRTKEEKFKQVLEFAQEDFSIQVAETKLLDGSSREVLSLNDQKESTQEAINTDKGDYFIWNWHDGKDIKKIVYGFLNEFLVLGKEPESVKTFFSEKTKTLNQNEFFRKTVLESNKSVSEYGFFDLQKWVQSFWKKIELVLLGTNTIPKNKTEELETLQSFSQQFPVLTFALEQNNTQKILHLYFWKQNVSAEK